MASKNGDYRSIIFLDNIVSDDDVANNVNEFELASAPDDYGTSYYFRGDAQNTFVLFAGMCWQVVRVDGNGNIKLILNNKNNTCNVSSSSSSGSIGNVKYNNLSTSNTYVGFMYGTPNSSTFDLEHQNLTKSNALTTLETWYRDNLVPYGDKIADVVWCNDKNPTLSSFGDSSYNNYAYGTNNKTYYSAYERLTNNASASANNNKPSFKCADSQGTDHDLSRFMVSSYAGNGKLTYKIGLLTADEAAFAGAGLYAAYTSQTSSYLKLYGTSSFRTMTPGYFNSNAYVFCLYYGGISQSSVSSAEHIRPVIALKSKVAISGGSGTSSNPYVVE